MICDGGFEGNSRMNLYLKLTKSTRNPAAALSLVIWLASQIPIGRQMLDIFQRGVS
jgi:hypothetical protein